MDALSLIEKIGKKERKITDLTFISPVFYNDMVATRIDGLLHTFTIPKTDPGWYVIKPVDVQRAEIIGKAEIHEKDKYLKYLGKIRMTLLLKKNDVYMGIPDKSNKYDLPFQEMAPVLLHDDMVLDFDRVIGRYDGSNIWFESVDMRNDPAKSDYLRESLEKHRRASLIKYEGLTFEEKLAYTLRTSLDEKFIKDCKKSSLKDDVEHAGGEFVRFVERSDHFSITYRVDGEQYTSHISKGDDRKVIAAGICLNGNDNRFDLRSLITVMREAQDKRVTYRVNVH